MSAGRCWQLWLQAFGAYDGLIKCFLSGHGNPFLSKPFACIATMLLDFHVYQAVNLDFATVTTSLYAPRALLKRVAQSHSFGCFFLLYCLLLYNNILILYYVYAAADGG